jgi:trk system potassium uptake protein TrkH
MSVTPRTAGFNTIDYSQVTEGTGFLTVILMFLGGSPGSTAGGVKTTTVALLVLLAWTRLRGRRSAVLWGRTVPEETLQRATGLFVTAFTILTGAILLLTVAGLPAVATAGVRGDFLARMFEAGSALGTVGLSMGLTPELTALGKGITVGLMLIGRVGALAVAAAIAAPERRSVQYRYAYEDVIVG